MKQDSLDYLNRPDERYLTLAVKLMMLANDHSESAAAKASMIFNITISDKQKEWLVLEYLAFLIHVLDRLTYETHAPEDRDRLLTVVKFACIAQLASSREPEEGKEIREALLNLFQGRGAEYGKCAYTGTADDIFHPYSATWVFKNHVLLWFLSMKPAQSQERDITIFLHTSLSDCFKDIGIHKTDVFRESAQLHDTDLKENADSAFWSEVFSKRSDAVGPIDAAEQRTGCMLLLVALALYGVCLAMVA